MTRRTFVNLIAAFVPTAMFARFTSRRIDPIDVTGIHTPPHLIEGIDGISHTRCLQVPKGLQVWLDGENVSARSSESDTVAGWVRMYDVEDDLDENGKFKLIIRWAGRNTRAVERIHFGTVVYKFA